MPFVSKLAVYINIIDCTKLWWAKYVDRKKRKVNHVPLLVLEHSLWVLLKGLGAPAEKATENSSIKYLPKRGL